MTANGGPTRREMRNTQACKLCRSRKVKCDSTRPKCSLCRAENVPCTYEQDRRQTSRVSQAVIQHITDRLTEVEETVHRLEESLSHRRHHAGHVQTPSDTAPSVVSPTHALQGLDDVGMFMDATPGHDPQNLYPETPAFDLDQGRKQGASIEIHTGVESDGGHISVYGPSSTFNPPISYTLYRQPRPAQFSATESKDTAEEECRLFANSALQIQKEWTYMAERKFDLDGLDLDTAWHLLQIHWNHHHQAYLTTYRPAVMHSLATGGPYINKLLLNAIYLSSALNSDRDELHEDPADRQSLGRRFFSRIQELTLSELGSSSVATAVAFLITGSSLVSVGRQTAGWHYSGLGYRMIIDLGLHVDPHKLRISHPDPSQPAMGFTEIDLELHRRVYWGAYINDKFQALYFGRPPTLTAIGIEPSRTFLDKFEELELWKPYVDPRARVPPPVYEPQPAYTLSTFQAFTYLADIMAGIVTGLYSPQVQFLSQEEILDVAGDLQKRLDAWMASLPRHLQYDPSQDEAPPAHRFNPPMTFHMLHILLHRPFLPEGHLRHLGASAETEHREICLFSAVQIYELARRYRDAFTLRRATYMISYCLFCAASVIPFGPRQSVDVSQRHIVGWFWIALKELQNGANFGLRKPIIIIRSLIEHAGLNLNSILAQTEPSRPASLEAGAGGQAHVQHDHGSGVSGVNGAMPPQGPDQETQVPEIEDADFETLCRDLIAGDIDGLAAPHGTDAEDHSLLYGLFR